LPLEAEWSFVINRKKPEMPHDFGKPLLLLAILVTFLVGSGYANDSEVPDGDSNTLISGFDAWAEGMETGTDADSSWEFPFRVPSPADMNSQEFKLLLALRRLAWNGDFEELESLADQVNRRQGEIPGQLRFWLAYAQNTLQQNQACLKNLQILLMDPQGWKILENGQQAWVLTSSADLNFLLGNRELAADLYERLAVSSVEQLNLWGKYQLAGMNFLARDFELASERYSMVCEAGKPGTWREHACSMAEIAGRLYKLGWKGETNGAIATTNP
jgi:hypothetical protein